MPLCPQISVSQSMCPGPARHLGPFGGRQAGPHPGLSGKPLSAPPSATDLDQDGQAGLTKAPCRPRVPWEWPGEFHGPLTSGANGTPQPTGAFTQWFQQLPCVLSFWKRGKGGSFCMCKKVISLFFSKYAELLSVVVKGGLNGAHYAGLG